MRVAALRREIEEECGVRAGGGASVDKKDPGGGKGVERGWWIQLANRDAHAFRRRLTVLIGSAKKCVSVGSRWGQGVGGNQVGDRRNPVDPESGRRACSISGGRSCSRGNSASCARAADGEARGASCSGCCGACTAASSGDPAACITTGAAACSGDSASAQAGCPLVVLLASAELCGALQHKKGPAPGLCQIPACAAPCLPCLPWQCRLCTSHCTPPRYTGRPMGCSQRPALT